MISYKRKASILSVCPLLHFLPTPAFPRLGTTMELWCYDTSGFPQKKRKKERKIQTTDPRTNCQSVCTEASRLVLRNCRCRHYLAFLSALPPKHKGTHPSHPSSAQGRRHILSPTEVADKEAQYVQVAVSVRILSCATGSPCLSESRRICIRHQQSIVDRPCGPALEQAGLLVCQHHPRHDVGAVRSTSDNIA